MKGRCHASISGHKRRFGSNAAEPVKPADARTKLKLISVRRNAIVHEADMDPLTNAKAPISRDECNDVTDFLLNCGNAIGRLVA